MFVIAVKDAMLQLWPVPEKKLLVSFVAGVNWKTSRFGEDNVYLKF